MHDCLENLDCMKTTKSRNRDTRADSRLTMWSIVQTTRQTKQRRPFTTKYVLGDMGNIKLDMRISQTKDAAMY